MLVDMRPEAAFSLSEVDLGVSSIVEYSRRVGQELSGYMPRGHSYYLLALGLDEDNVGKSASPVTSISFGAEDWQKRTIFLAIIYSKC